VPEAQSEPEPTSPQQPPAAPAPAAHVAAPQPPASDPAPVSPPSDLTTPSQPSDHAPQSPPSDATPESREAASQPSTSAATGPEPSTSVEPAQEPPTGPFGPSAVGNEWARPSGDPAPNYPPPTGGAWQPAVQSPPPAPPYPTSGYPAPPPPGYPSAGQPLPAGYQPPPGYPPAGYPGQYPPPAAKSRGRAYALTGLAVLVLIIVATVAGGLLVRSHSGGKYTIGSCVSHTGSKPHRVDCGTPGAYRVASEVTDPQRCSPGAPYIEVDHSPRNRIYCLVPAS
jgi:hypothetical protein